MKYLIQFEKLYSRDHGYDKNYKDRFAMFLNRNSCTSNIQLKYSELWENEQKLLEDQIDGNKWQIEHFSEDGKISVLKRGNSCAFDAD